MQIEISLLQHMISISTRSMFPALAPPSPADYDPFPAPPRTLGGEWGGWGGVTRPSPPRPCP